MVFKVITYTRTTLGKVYNMHVSIYVVRCA